MKLTELEPRFVRHASEPAWGLFNENGKTVGRWHMQQLIVTVPNLAEAQGVMFLCPKCFQTNGGKAGTHRVVCWSRSRGVPEHVAPSPGRWNLDGTDMHDLTLNGDQPGDKPRDGARSVLLTSGCEWHGFVTNGEVT